MTFTFAEGDLVRVEGWRGVYRLKRNYLTAGECDVWGPAENPGMRLVASIRLLPALPGDTAPAEPAKSA